MSKLLLTVEDRFQTVSFGLILTPYIERDLIVTGKIKNGDVLRLRLVRPNASEETVAGLLFGIT